MEIIMSYKPSASSAKVLVLDAKGRCLLLNCSMSSEGNPGKWDLPGGKVDVGENLEQGLLRKVAEETGLTISLQRVLGAAGPELPAKRVACLILGGAAVTFGMSTLPQTVEVQPVYG
jgi:8-oxo-dGTP diphosphatase